jgi:hypothetical protein
MAMIGTNLFAGTYGGGAFLSTDNGTSWTQVINGYTNTSVNSFAVSGTNLFAGSNGAGVFLSTNYGTSWTSISTGLTNNIINALAVSGTKLMAGTWGSGVWSRPLSEITSVQSTSSVLPTEFKLQQNYPNPFNPTTNIKFDVAKMGNVKIAVFDVTGREVQMLVNESMNPGTYEVTFDGSKLTSGIYFYKISVGDFIDTKRMLMVK